MNDDSLAELRRGFENEDLAGVAARLKRHRDELAAVLPNACASPHAAAALGLMERLRDLLDRQPELVHAKGGDGGRPLHFSRNVQTSRLLAERGARFAMRSCVEARRHPEGDFARVVALLLEAGTPLDDGQYASGNERIDEAIRTHRNSGS
jgi:hypothetical protein